MLAICFRLKKIVRLLENGEIEKSDIIKNLQYAITVLEAVYVDETK